MFWYSLSGDCPSPIFNPGFFFALRFVKEASVLPPDGGAGGPLKDSLFPSLMAILRSVPNR